MTSPRAEQTGLVDEFEPVLSGKGATDYERYLRTDELLALQKPPEERAHHDELLFQTVHQSSELWLKLAWSEVEAAAVHLRGGEIPPALRLLRRSCLALRLATDQLDMLALMSPWEYTVAIRPVLGHGSGFDSPGWNGLRRVAPDLAAAFHGVRREHGLSLAELYRRGREFEELYLLAEALVDLDERATMWRVRHLTVVEREIGGLAVGTQGTPVELLEGLLRRKLFPELWQARNHLTELAKLEE